MCYRFFICVLLSFFSVQIVVQAQHSVSSDVLAIIADIHTFKKADYPNDGADIVRQAIGKMKWEDYRKASFFQYNQYSKTVISALVDEDSIRQQIDRKRIDNSYIFRKLVLPFEPWLQYARRTGEGNESELTTLLYENYQTLSGGRQYDRTYTALHASRYEGFYQLIGRQNTEDLLNLLFGEVDITRPESQMMLLSFQSPLAPDALATYSYHLMGTKTIQGVVCSEIAFYSLDSRKNTFAGYLYIRADGTYALQQAVLTLNDPEQMNFISNLLLTYTYTTKESAEGDVYIIPQRYEHQILLGYPGKGMLSANRLSVCDRFTFATPAGKPARKNTIAKDYARKDSVYWESVRPVPLSVSQTQVEELMAEARHTPVFTLMQDAILTLVSNHVTIGGINGSVELGPLSQFISYNHMEGMRFKLGGNTTINLTDRLMMGGYLAYGTTDRKLKYRTDLAWSLTPKTRYIWEYPKKLFTFTYVNDLNIPGQDLLTTTRDNVVNSFSHAPTDNMSLQKIGLISFEHEPGHQFSYKIAGKYTFDQPAGVVQYLQVSGADTTVVNHITTSEVILSLSWTPKQSSIQNRDKRILIRRGDIELSLNHRIGLKGVIGSDYNYQITDISAYKKITFDHHVGSMDIRLSGGKVWNRVPFPLLFIPTGNQSYIYHADDYNCMNFYEFVTDQYVALHANCLFNWSPFKWFDKQNKTQVSMGVRGIYGPLSDNNDPSLHPELFVFNQGVKPLTRTPYVEVNIGLANLFKILRVEYARRLTYLSQDDASGGKKTFAGSLLVTGSFAF